MKNTLLVIGGARSGKSSFALDIADSIGGRKAYVATCEPLDIEMAERIKRHRQERSGGWETIEEPVDIGRVIGDELFDVMVVDCLTLWLSNLMHRGLDPEGEIDALAKRTMEADGPTLILVSNEVGMGIVPDNPMARRFRDLSGLMNRRLAASCSEVWLITAGIPLRIKGGV